MRNVLNRIGRILFVLGASLVLQETVLADPGLVCIVNNTIASSVMYAGKPIASPNAANFLVPLTIPTDVSYTDAAGFSRDVLDIKVAYKKSINDPR